MSRLLIVILWLCTTTAMASTNEQAAASLLGLVEPVAVGNAGKCPDGGSTKGYLVDANGKEYHFFIDFGLGSKNPGRWYVGEDFSTGKATMLADEDPRRQAILTLLIAWINNTLSEKEQAALRALPQYPRPDTKRYTAAVKAGEQSRSALERLRDEALRPATQWFIVKHFMTSETH